MHEMYPFAAHGPELIYLVRNASDEPVYGVVMNAMCGVHGTFVRFLGTLGPGEARELRIRLPGSARAGEYPPALAFVDSAGRQWLRDARGKLNTASAEKADLHQTEDPGTYPSIEEHPTLRLDAPGYETAGKRVAYGALAEASAKASALGQFL